MKKVLFAAIFLIALVLTSCNTHPSPSSVSNPQSAISSEDTSTVIITGENTMLEKLYQIKPDWTEQQVHDLLGEPDEQGQASVVMQDYYNVDDKTRATIYYWNEGIQIELVNLETSEMTVILEPPT